jgi:signal transduction histidine kinase
MRVLLADDSRLVRHGVGNALREWGFEVLEAHDGLEAWAHLQQQPDIAIAVLDWQMPGLEGPEVCQRLRTLEQRAYIYTIMLTAQSDELGVSKAIELGADDYITKSAPLHELQARLKAARRIVLLQQRLIEDGRRLGRAQRMEALGNLAAGMAHELNTPVQYISHNTEFLHEEFSKLLSCLQDTTSKTLPACPDLAYLRTEIPATIAQTLQGLERVKQIINALRDFTSPAGSEWCSTEISRLVESSVTIAQNQWNEYATLALELPVGLPTCECIPQDLSQAILQIVLNAGQAIQRKVKGTTARGLITVRAECCEATLCITIEDNGIGIDPEIREQIFDPFFTNREVGSSLGTGLAFVHSAIVERHQGLIDVHSEVGVGTRVVLRLPLVRTQERELLPK